MLQKTGAEELSVDSIETKNVCICAFDGPPPYGGLLPLSLVDAYSYVVMLFLLAPEHGSRHHALVTYIEDADHVNVDIVP